MSDSNDNCCSATACPDLLTNSRSSIQDETTNQNKDNECNEVAPPKEHIDFKVIYNKQKIDVNFPLDGTVADLKAHLQNIIAVPQGMQKVMIKGLAKDDQTLRSLGVTKGTILFDKFNQHKKKTTFYFGLLSFFSFGFFLF